MTANVFKAWQTGVKATSWRTRLQQAVRPLRPVFMNAKTFIGMMVFLSLLGVGLTAYLFISVGDGMTWVRILVLFCFLPLFFNNAWMFLHALYYPFVKPVVFKEQALPIIPATAIIFFIREEAAGLYERMEYTFRNNCLPNTDLWIVSGQGEQRFIDYECDVIKRLRQQFGEHRVRRLHSDDPKNKKREMMDIWLESYYREYKYFVSCDADSMMPKNTVLRLLRKAEHPENRGIGCFQANALVASAWTYFANNNRSGVSILMELYLKVKQAVVGETLSFGHNYLCLSQAALDLKIPDGMMSHDIWDTVYMRRRGYKTVFCYDVYTYEESPSNYLEERRRNVRWMKGDFESVRLLFEKGVNFEMWFQVYFNIHLYLSAFCFFIIFNLGIFCDWGASPWWKTALIIQYILSYGIFAMILLHRLIIAHSWKDMGEIVKEIGISTMVASNSVLYVIVDSILVLFDKQGWSLWQAMRKDPREGATWARSAKTLWPSTLIGLIWFSILWAERRYSVIGWAAPILISYIFSIPFTRFSSLEMKNRLAGSTLTIHRGHRQ